MHLPIENTVAVTERMVQKAFYEQFRNQYLALVPNTFLLGWEADILALDDKLVPHEFEIKLSSADVKNDAKKSKLTESGDAEIEILKKYDVVYNGKGASTMTYIIPSHLLSKTIIPESFGIMTFDVLVKDSEHIFEFTSQRTSRTFHQTGLEMGTFIRLFTNLADHRFSESLKGSDEILSQNHSELKRKYQRLKRKFEAELSAQDFVSQWNLQFDNQLQTQLDVISEILLAKKELLSKEEIEKLTSSGFIGF